MGQKETHALEQIAFLFDHLVSELLQLWGHVKAEPLGSVEADNKSKFGRLGSIGRSSWFQGALSPLQCQLAHEIAFSKRRALLAENVVSCGCMEKEVRQRERHQKAFCRERKRAVADPEG